MSDTEYDSDYGENKVITDNFACGRGERGDPAEPEEDAEIEQAVENTIKEVEAQPIDEPEQEPAKKLTKKEKAQKEKKQASEKQKLALKKARETRAKKQAEKKAKKELEAEQKKQKAEDARINKLVEKRLKERLKENGRAQPQAHQEEEYNDEIDGQPVYLQQNKYTDIEPNQYIQAGGVTPFNPRPQAELSQYRQQYLPPRQYAQQQLPPGAIPQYAIGDPHLSSLFMRYGRR